MSDLASEEDFWQVGETNPHRPFARLWRPWMQIGPLCRGRAAGISNGSWSLRPRKPRPLVLPAVSPEAVPGISLTFISGSPAYFLILGILCGSLSADVNDVGLHSM
jgi:hypothetical protein